MSLLLDALKKSEEQRRLGAQPDIHRESAQASRDDATATRLWLPLTLVVAAVLAISWLGWRQFREPEPGAVPSPVVDATLPTPEVEERPVEKDGADATPVARTPVETFAAAEAPAADTSVESTEPAVEQARREALQSFSEFRETSPAQADPAAKQAATAAPESVAQASTTPAEAKSSAPPTIQQAPPAQDAPYEPAPMSYWALPQGVRDSLPSFRISVLVYAEDPADRFVLVNGMRLKEKQELQTGVVLDEIRRDGAVFRARNYRFLVKG